MASVGVFAVEQEREIGLAGAVDRLRRAASSESHRGEPERPECEHEQAQ